MIASEKHSETNSCRDLGISPWRNPKRATEEKFQEKIPGGISAEIPGVTPVQTLERISGKTPGEIRRKTPEEIARNLSRGIPREL